MHYLLGFLVVCALGVLPLVGCGDEPECRSAADCDDDNGCTKDHCTDGECHYTTDEYEGHMCGLGGRCRDGRCVLEGVRNPISGEECSAAPQGDAQLPWFLVALVFVGIWRTVRRSANRT